MPGHYEGEIRGKALENPESKLLVFPEMSPFSHSANKQPFIHSTNIMSHVYGCQTW